MNEKYQCTAGDLATPDPKSLAQDTTVGDAVQWFDAKGYDVAPIVENDVPIGYTKHEQLKEVPEDDLVGDHRDEITIDEILDSETSFPDLLVALYESEFYFLGGRNRLAGIITRADINRAPTYMHLYAELSTLEQLFRRLILESAPDWKDRIRLHSEKVERIEQRHKSAQEANIELDEIFYAQFSTQVKIVRSIESCWQACGYSSENEANLELDDVINLRNDIAHSTPVLQNTRNGMMEDGRTISKLEATYMTIQECIDELNSSVNSRAPAIHEREST